MYANGTGVAQDHTEAVRLYRLAADQSARAQVNLGRMYEDGTGVSQDHTEAVRFYRLAADQGYATAQCYLGMMYCDGTGIPQDLAKAAWLFKLAVAGEVAGVMVMTPLFSSPVGSDQKWRSLFNPKMVKQGPRAQRGSFRFSLTACCRTRSDSHQKVCTGALAC